MSDVSGIPNMGFGGGNFFAPQFSYNPQMSAGQASAAYMPAENYARTSPTICMAAAPTTASAARPTIIRPLARSTAPAQPEPATASSAKAVAAAGEKYPTTTSPIRRRSIISGGGGYGGGGFNTAAPVTASGGGL